MRRRITVIAAAALSALAISLSSCAGGPPAPGPAASHGGAGRPPRAAARPSYYLSLGDSLAQGVQPDSAGASVATGQGYPDRLFAVLHRRVPSLRLIKLGCSGESTRTMIRGGICSYRGGSQLTTAEQFLRAHRRQVSLITIDIGANDPNSCILGFTFGKLPACIDASVRNTTANLTAILRGLRAAGGRRVQIVGMSYYVPELAGWLDGRIGQEIAVLTERLVAGYNRLLAGIYRRYGARVANVFGAFHSGDFTDRVRLPGIGVVPRNVATVCRWTWSCTTGPRGPNEHANNVGYRIIALAFLLAGA